MAHWPELQYCKTDLIASKGVVFCKFSQSSSALRALESIADNGMVRSGFYRRRSACDAYDLHMVHHISTLTQEYAAPCSSLGTRSSACLPSLKASAVVQTAVAAAWTPARPGGRCPHLLWTALLAFEACTPTWRHMVVPAQQLVKRLAMVPPTGPGRGQPINQRLAWRRAGDAPSRPARCLHHCWSWWVCTGAACITDETCNYMAGYVVVTMPVTSLQACRQLTRAPLHLD